MKKIYINGRFLTQDITGVQRYAHNFVKALDKLNCGFEIIVLTPQKGLKHKLTLKNIKIKTVGFLSSHVWEQIELPKYSKDGFLFCMGNTAPLYSLFANKVIVTIHSLAFKFFPKTYSLQFRLFYNFITPIIIKKAYKIITVSNCEKNLITKVYPKAERKITAVQNGCFNKDLIEKIKDLPIKKLEKPFGIYVGSLSRSKNFQRIISAFSEALKKREVGLVLIGTSQKVFNQHKINLPKDCLDKIIFQGQINDPLELISWYKGAEFLIFPSLYESSGLPPVEAMACGCPVIVSDLPALKERCKTAALYCDPYDVKDITDKILQILDNHDLKSELIKKGIKQSSKYTWEKCVTETLKVFE